MAGIDDIGSAGQQASMALTMYKQATWIHVMADAFKETDKQVAALEANGPWTVSTRNVQEYAHRFQAYA
jgi:hypothetical protein